MKAFITFVLIFTLLEISKSSNSCFGPCLKIYEPVCGFNGEEYKVFSNECVMKNIQCRDNKKWFRVSDLFCGLDLADIVSLTKNLCIKPCTREYLPVCGSNGELHKVFSNKCVMENERCVDHKEWFEVKMSMCSIKH